MWTIFIITTSLQLVVIWYLHKENTHRMTIGLPSNWDDLVIGWDEVACSFEETGVPSGRLGSLVIAPGKVLCRLNVLYQNRLD